MLVGAVALPASIALALLVPSIGAGEAGWRGIFGHKQTLRGSVDIMARHGFTLEMLRGLPENVPRHIRRYVRCADHYVSIADWVGFGSDRSSSFWHALAVAKDAAQAGSSHLLLALPLAAVALYGMHVFSPRIFASVGKDSTLSQRTIIWAAAWDAAVKRPILGYGFAAFWKGLYGPSQSVVLIAGWGLEQAQDGFLDVWLEVGVVGLALFAAMTGQGMRNAIRSFYSWARKRTCDGAS